MYEEQAKARVYTRAADNDIDAAKASEHCHSVLDADPGKMRSAKAGAKSPHGRTPDSQTNETDA